MVASSSPAFYWAAAQLLPFDLYSFLTSHRPTEILLAADSRKKLYEENRKINGKTLWKLAKPRILIWYFAGYALMGTVLHCSFYPWT